MSQVSWTLLIALILSVNGALIAVDRGWFGWMLTLARRLKRAIVRGGSRSGDG